MDYYYSSSSDHPMYIQLHHHHHHNNIPDFIPQNQTQSQLLPAVEDDKIIPTFEPEINDICFHQIPATFIEADPTKKTSHQIVQPIKRLSESSLAAAAGVNRFDDDQENDEKDSKNERKKKQKILHREVERQRRLEMSSLHTSLKSLLPLQSLKGKRSISDHLEETVKYINQMQRNIQELIDRRDSLTMDVSTLKVQQEIEVVVNAFKGCLEIIVSIKDNDGEQGLTLSKVLQCLIQEGLDVVNSFSTRVNNNIVHSIHAQVGDKDSIVIDAKILKQKLANIKR